MADGFEVRYTDGKGFGCFATKEFETGERILVERVILSIANHEDISHQLKDVHHNFVNRLSASEQEQYLQLHAWEDPTRLASLRNVLKKAGIPPEEIEKYCQIYLIFVSNQFIIQEAVGSVYEEVTPAISGIFLKGSRLNHSCDSNCNWNLMARPGHLIVKACRPIKEGDELTLSYLSNNSLPRESRQRELRWKWGFTCLCPRCHEWDSEYDARLSDVLEGQRHVYDHWRERENGERLPDQSRDGNEIPVRDLIERRIELLTELHWHPELFFAYCDMAECQLWLLAEANPAGGADRPYLEDARDCLEEAVSLGEQCFSEDEILVAEARHELDRVIGRLG